MAPERIGEWDVIARKTDHPIGPIMNFITRLLFVVPEAPRHSKATWTIRHVRTGEVRKITAYSEEEFSQRLSAGAFD